MDYTELLRQVLLNTGHVAVFFLSINILLILLHFKKLSTPFRRLFYFLIFSFCIEITTRVIFFTYPGTNNLPLLHFYTLGEFILYSWFYHSLIKKAQKLKSWFWYFVIGVSAVIILNSLFIQSIYDFNSIAKTSVQIIIIGYAIMYFLNLTEDQPLSHSSEKSLRLINSAILVYYSGSLFVFMCGQISFIKGDIYLIFWTFNAILNVVFQILILIAVWKIIFKKIPLSS